MDDTGRIPDTETLGHRLAIQDVLFKHCRGVDRADLNVLKSAYWPDAEVAYGALDGNAHEFCGMLVQGIQRYQATHHQVSNICCDITGNDAVVESYVTAYHYLPGEAGAADTEMTYVGRYVDHMQLRDNIWKLKFRRVVMDWNQNMNTTADFDGPTLSKLARSAREPDDPLYAMQQEILS